MERPDQITEYRFRVHTADGKEAVSPVVVTRRPLRGQEQLPTLANPRWSSQSFAHGDRATLQVDAPGLDGREVRFVVERRDGEQWSAVQTLEAKVANGVAEAQMQLAHPDPSDPAASPADLRFSCELA
jgi:hypothetical protein